MFPRLDFPRCRHIVGKPSAIRSLTVIMHSIWKYMVMDFPLPTLSSYDS
ncbi:hypothetical protein SAMN05414139_04758 [Burkholderia sp. D7]|nr:hypothetical protein SAMN05414139_04758 [Burkholderia sp. D7]